MVNLNNTFENFKPEPGTELAKKAVMNVIEGPRFMLMLYGGAGNGKTHLLHAASIELYKRGLFARVMDFRDMLSYLKSAIENPEKNYAEILAGYCFADRLILDDIGVGEKQSYDFCDRILDTIVCTRYGRELLTIMVTNRDIDTLPERVLSRLKDKTTSYLVLNSGEDYRPKKEKT